MQGRIISLILLEPSHLDRILKTWNVTGDLHSNVAKSGVVLIGPRRNVLLAYKHIRDAETAIIVVEVPVHQLISCASQNQKHAKHTIPMHALEAIAYNTRTCITGSLEGNAVSIKHISHVNAHEIGSTTEYLRSQNLVQIQLDLHF